MQYTVAVLPRPGELCEVVIEYPRGSVIKRRADGRIDFVSPLPCPYNYGHIPGVRSGDGDMLDAIVLGRRLPAGLRLQVPVVGRLGFTDAGLDDPKIVCSAAPLSLAQRRGLELFFVTYALWKRGLAAARGVAGETRFLGWL